MWLHIVHTDPKNISNQLLTVKTKVYSVDLRPVADETIIQTSRNCYFKQGRWNAWQSLILFRKQWFKTKLQEKIYHNYKTIQESLNRSLLKPIVPFLCLYFLQVHNFTISKKVVTGAVLVLSPIPTSKSQDLASCSYLPCRISLPAPHIPKLTKHKTS